MDSHNSIPESLNLEHLDQQHSAVCITQEALQPEENQVDMGKLEIASQVSSEENERTASDINEHFLHDTNIGINSDFENTCQSTSANVDVIIADTSSIDPPKSEANIENTGEPNQNCSMDSLSLNISCNEENGPYESIESCNDSTCEVSNAEAKTDDMLEPSTETENYNENLCKNEEELNKETIITSTGISHENISSSENGTTNVIEDQAPTCNEEISELSSPDQFASLADSTTNTAEIERPLQVSSNNEDIINELSKDEKENITEHFIPVSHEKPNQETVQSTTNEIISAGAEDNYCSKLDNTSEIIESEKQKILPEKLNVVEEIIAEFSDDETELNNIENSTTESVKVTPAINISSQKHEAVSKVIPSENKETPFQIEDNINEIEKDEVTNNSNELHCKEISMNQFPECNSTNLVTLKEICETIVVKKSLRNEDKDENAENNTEDMEKTKIIHEKSESFQPHTQNNVEISPEKVISPPPQNVVSLKDSQNFIINENSEMYIMDESNNLLLVNAGISNEIEVEISQKVDQVEYKMELINQEKHETKLEKPIPTHLLGIDLQSVAQAPNARGKPSPKPRLGVKVPYRNLTSQIVSKKDIEQEVLKRQQQKIAETSAGGVTLFAKKLTQNLAKKIIGDDNSPSSSKVPTTLVTKKVLPPSRPEHIQNNSDLIAILEGDGDDIVVDMKAQNLIVKEVEKEIALKQLTDLEGSKKKPKKSDNLPYNYNIKQEIVEPSPKIKTAGEIGTTEYIVIASNVRKVDVSKDINIKKEENKKIGSTNEVNSKGKENTINKDNSTLVKSHVVQQKNSKEVSTTKPSKVKEEVAANFSSKAPIKTYTRKRKQTEEESPVVDAKKLAGEVVKVEKLDTAPGNVYMTKSSRIIKKKVIWDPAETQPQRSVFKSPKIADVKTSPKSSESTSSKPPTKLQNKVIEIKQDKNVQKIAKVISTSPKAAIVSVSKKPGGVITTKTIKIIKKDVQEKPKRLTEVDKLLMDEGAVNMLYAIKNMDENQNTNKQTRKSIVNKAQDDILNKTKEIKTDLETNTTNTISPKSLRRKDSPLKSPNKLVTPAAISRQKSKDSNRSSIHSPPASPAMMYPEASKIIRRHSSSSFSSEDESTNHSNERNLRRKTANNIADGPKAKKARKLQEIVVTEKIKSKDESSSKFNKLTEPILYPSCKTISIKKMENLYQLDFIAVAKEVYLTCEILKEISSVIKELSGNSDCNAILMTSSGSSFCLGLDYKSLVSDKEPTRKSLAKDLSSCVKDFLQAIVNCPKIMIAGIHGSVEGLAVMMLPLFDIVVASDSASFSTPYGKLGCIPEGNFIYNLPHLMSNVLMSELILSQRKMVAAEVQRIGLVTRVIWSDKFKEELIDASKTAANQSSQFLEATKKLMKKDFITNVDKQLAAETDLLIKQWTSEECQKNFSQLK